VTGLDPMAVVIVSPDWVGVLIAAGEVTTAAGETAGVGVGVAGETAGLGAFIGDAGGETAGFGVWV